MSPTADSPVTCSFANASDSAFTSSLEFTSGSIDKSNSNLYISAISGGTSSTSGTTTTLTASESSPIKLTVQDAAGNTYTLAATSGSYTYTTASGGVGSDYLIQYVSGGELPTSTATLPSADGTTTTISMKNTDLLFTTAGKYYSGSPTTTTMTLSNGALETQTITLDCNSLTQFAGSSTINGTADGNAAGTLKSVSIDSSGVITGVYTNGVKQSEAQIAIAQFTNASGLTKTGSSLYQASSNSGTPNVKTAADLGVSITPSALEMSNVDIANEFSDMIITQRGFQSNSKIITVSDEMLETMINMKR
jgi:flagellar hook protein FlgE